LRDLTFVLDERIKKNLVTIFTSNLKKSELKEKLNERIVSRILYNCDVIIMQGEDKRSITTNYFII
jgi:DNA replication protein DnaC